MSLRSALLSCVVLAASVPAFAGDCPVHPMTLIDATVVSCAPLSAANASKVVPGQPKGPLSAEVTQVVAERGAVVLEVQTHRTRTIHIDGPGLKRGKPKAEAWAPQQDTRWLLLRTGDADVCKRFPAKARTVFAHPTDCGCDTGPIGWCALDLGAMVGEVPANLASFKK